MGSTPYLSPCASTKATITSVGGRAPPERKKPTLTQDLVRSSQLTDLTLQVLNPYPLIAGETVAAAAVNLCPAHPLAKRFCRATYLRRDRADGRPLGFVLVPVIEHHPDRPLAYLWGIPVSFCHDSNPLKKWSLRQVRGDSPPIANALLSSSGSVARFVLRAEPR